MKRTAALTRETVNKILTKETINKIWFDIEKLAFVQQRALFESNVAKLIMRVDSLISEQLSLIMQTPSFKKLESSWRGLQSLAASSSSFRRVRIKVLDLSWEQIATDVGVSFDIRKSFLYRKVYIEELDTAGGTPFGMLLIDHLVRADYDDGIDDLYTLQLLSELGESTLCPILLGLNEFFFGDDPERIIHDSSRAQRILETRDYLSWKLLREKESSKFLNLVFPEYQIRTAYRNCVPGFIFNEANNNKNALWCNAAYLLAINVVREFDRINWFGFLRSYDEFGTYGAILSNQKSQPIITKVDVFSENDGIWSDFGFVPLTSLYLTKQKGFFSNQSVWKIPQHISSIIGMLQTNLMACRFAHYIKIQFRDQIGRFDTVTGAKNRLEKWLRKYTSKMGQSDDHILAAYPLKDFKVIMEQDDNDETRFMCQIMLQPQYQYELMDAQIFLNLSFSGEKKGENQ